MCDLHRPQKDVSLAQNHKNLRESEQLQQVIDQLGIDDLREKTVLQLSNGERRKVQIARALLRRPRVLILDNPFAGLDANFRARFRQLIAGLMRSEICVIVAATLCDEIPDEITHILRVDEGRVTEQGPRQQVLPPNEIAPPDDALARTPILPRLERREPCAFADQDGRPSSNGGQMPLIRLDQVNVAYDGVSILTDVSWTVRRGEHWALLGPNGAGKTTLLGLILGDHPQVYANRVWVFGQRRGQGESIWEIKRRIGWLAPELHLYYPHDIAAFSVVCSGFFDSVGLYRRPTDEQRQTAQLWIDTLGIAAYAHSPFGALSQGQQRMALIARALVKTPDLLILDEPCQGLDAANAARVRHTVDLIGQQTDATIIYVTHNQQEIPATIARTLRLEHGRVCAP